LVHINQRLQAGDLLELVFMAYVFTHVPKYTVLSCGWHSGASPKSALRDNLTQNQATPAFRIGETLQRNPYSSELPGLW
jgi:hypothetical protein